MLAKLVAVGIVVGLALEQRFGDIAAREPDLLAYHFGEAGLLPLACNYRMLAGDQAVSRSAYAEAIAHFTAGLKLAEALPPQEGLRRQLEFWLKIGSSSVVAHGLQSVQAETAYTTRLVDGLETATRAAFGSRLATTRDAPRKVIRLLAFDAAVEVAGPVLSQSPRVSDEMLVENAKSMGQDHLLAISKRKELNESVTDVLLERGNEAVVSSTAGNEGSRFSESGFSKLIEIGAKCEARLVPVVAS